MNQEITPPLTQATAGAWSFNNASITYLFKGLEVKQLDVEDLPKL